MTLTDSFVSVASETCQNSRITTLKICSWKTNFSRCLWGFFAERTHLCLSCRFGTFFLTLVWKKKESSFPVLAESQSLNSPNPVKLFKCTFRASHIYFIYILLPSKLETNWPVSLNWLFSVAFPRKYSWTRICWGKHKKLGSLSKIADIIALIKKEVHSVPALLPYTNRWL